MSAHTLLAPGLEATLALGARPMPRVRAIDALLPLMLARLHGSVHRRAPQAAQRAALQRFRASTQPPSFRDTCVLTWALGLRPQAHTPCLFEDAAHFARLLDAVCAWGSRAHALRRACEGLVHSYFDYDADHPAAPARARAQWQQLRTFLHERLPLMAEPQLNPPWLVAALAHPALFTAAPCAPYAASAVAGDTAAVDALCAVLPIAPTSWWWRALARAQLAHAVELGPGAFALAVPHLLQRLAQHDTVRDGGLRQLLDCSARAPGAQAHPGLADAARRWWGHPMRDPPDPRWSSVGPLARQRAGAQLQLQCVQEFFTRWTDDVAASARRLAFWSRYVHRVDQLQVALASGARQARREEVAALGQMLAGPPGVLGAAGAAGANQHALILRLGALVVVEFSRPHQAVYGYDARRPLPFDLAQPLQLGVNARNSLKHQPPSRVLWLNHQDGAHGWDRWEEMFETLLADEFDLAPQAPPGHAGAGAGFTRRALRAFAQAAGLTLDDKSLQGGSVWVRTGDADPQVNRVLAQWRFHHLPGKGWWR